MRHQVLISCPQLQATISRYRHIFEGHNIDIDLPEMVQQLKESELLEIISRFDGVIAGDDEFTAKVLSKGKRLKTVARWGVGVDNVDLEAAQRLGIQVTNTPGVFSDEVADVVIGYVILLARGLHLLDQSVREGTWRKIQGTSLRNKVLGIIGFGGIGQAVAGRGTACGMNILAHDSAGISDNVLRQTGAKAVDFQSLIREADFISLNCNLTPENRGILNARTFSSMKKGVYIINTARGPLIDENDLATALDEGTVAGTALDVFESEPLRPDSPLRLFDNCIFGTHNSSNTIEAVLRVNEQSIKNLLQGLGYQT